MKPKGVVIFLLIIIQKSPHDSALNYKSFISASSLPTLPTTITDSRPVINNPNPIESCNEPLGMQSRKIGKHQILQGSYLLPEFAADNARLNKTTFPQGFLSDKKTCGHSKTSGYVAVIFDTKTVVTGIATQGYGDQSKKEWVKSFSLYWRKTSSPDEQYVMYKPPKFIGNSDSNTIKYNKIPHPKEVKSILLIPIECNKDKVGLRMELYGCVIKKTYVLWIRLMRKRFHKFLFSPKDQQFQDLESTIKSEVFACTFHIARNSNAYEIRMNNALAV